MMVNTSDPGSIKPYTLRFSLPTPISHKGQNHRILVIGGSSLFHSASIWAAEIASYFVDIVHYASTTENNEIMLSNKKKFHNGIVVAREHLLDYIKEDDAILVGPGMLRTDKSLMSTGFDKKYEELLKLSNEGEFTYLLTRFLITNFPDKQFVFDAGAIQMMDANWLKNLKTNAIITPHEKEFASLFNIDLSKFSFEDRKKTVQEYAGKYHCVIVLKGVYDIVSDGNQTVVVEGGNAGLTKGGTGDILAGLVTGIVTKTDSFKAGVIASYLLKRASDRLFNQFGYWYNIGNLLEQVPQELKEILL